jgi:hypothetical protein
MKREKKDRKMSMRDRQRDRETERQRDRETERDRERQRDRDMERVIGIEV